MESLVTVMGRKLEVSPKFVEIASSDPLKAEGVCRICGETGMRVLQVTIATHIDAQYWKHLSDGYRFCFSPECPVIYFNNRLNKYFVKDEVKTRFGPKEKEPPRPLCYCLQVTEEQIIEEIMEKQCCFSLQDIIAYTKAGTGKWCFITNPSGKCCREYLPSIVENYLKMVGKEPVKRNLESAKLELAKEEPMRKVLLSVRGMTCESCATHVKTILEKIGARDVKVFLDGEKAEMLAPIAFPLDELTNLIEESGYKASVLKAERSEK